jgi:hypothetical protein
MLSVPLGRPLGFPEMPFLKRVFVGGVRFAAMWSGSQKREQLLSAACCRRGRIWDRNNWVRPAMMRPYFGATTHRELKSTANRLWKTSLPIRVSCSCPVIFLNLF